MITAVTKTSALTTPVSRRGSRQATSLPRSAPILRDAKYDQDSISYLISWCVMKSEAPLSGEQCARHSLDMDGPSGRNCNRRRRSRSRGVGPWQASRFATAASVVWLRRVTRDLFSWVLLSGCRVGPSCWQHSAWIGFFIAKIAQNKSKIR
jgi:hypothetical protein